MRSEVRRHLGPLRRAKWILGSTALGVRAIAHLQGYAENLVTTQTDIVLEGFPRSGNSMLRTYISLCNPGLQLAHHLHMVGQFTIARHLGIPSVLLIRNPADSVSSLLVADPTLSVEQATEWWVYYYRSLIPHRDRLLILPFDQVMSDPQGAVTEIANFSGLEISAPTYDQPMRERINQALVARGSVARGGYLEKKMPNLIPIPTPEKDALKERNIESTLARVKSEGAMDIYSLFIGR